MIYKHKRTCIGAFLLGIIIMPLIYGDAWGDGSKRHMPTLLAKDAHYGEWVKWTDYDAAGNLWVLSFIEATGETKITVNGLFTLWRSTQDAKPAGSANLKIICTKTIKDFTIKTNADGKLTVNMTGRLEAITDNGWIHYLQISPEGACSWIHDPAVKGVQFYTVGNDGDAWALSDSARQQVPAPHWQSWRRTKNGTWEAKQGWDIRCIAACNGRALMISNWGWIWEWNYQENNWDRIKHAGAIKHIAFGPTSFLWSVSAAGIGSWRLGADSNWVATGGENLQIISLGATPDGKEVATAITSAHLHNAPKKFQFQLIPDGIVSELHSRFYP